ncbi:MAG TPA: glycoside hydrolase family 38 C-terminal domain-containing protein [bacterium]|nr:glycoside hydrolase family 38 C-terminal domain-containing protein [bacterium]
MDLLEKWEESVKNLEQRINKYLHLNEWKFKQNCSEGAKVEIDDSNWEKKTQPIHWALKDGDTYLRKWIEIPEEIEGIKIEGSKIYLKFVFPSGVTLFINGKEVYSHKFWADKIATPFLLTENAKPNEKFLIVFKTDKGDGLGGFWAYLSIKNLNDIVFQLKSILYQLKFAQIILKETKKKKLSEIIKKCYEKLDSDLIIKKDWEKIKNVIKDIENLLESFKPYAKKFKVHLIGHAHIDMNWLWTYEDTVSVVLRDFTTIINLMDKYKDLTFSQSQTHVYDITKENDKKLFKKVKDKVKSGNWEITANAWVENDLNMSDGESIVRHIIYSKKYIKENFDKDVKIMWSPDTFGHPFTIPSIIKNADINYYYFMRCGKGYPLFIWEGPDKNKVIAFNSIYNNQIDSDRIIPLFIDYYKRYKIKDFMFVYGVGDHGGGPTEEDIERKIKLNEKPCFPNLEFSTTEKYFKIIEKYKNRLPIVKDELNFIFEGCYTTHSDIKRNNRNCENILLKLETLSSIFSINNKQYPENEIEKMWQKTLFNQFHDILDGSAIHKSYDYSNTLANEVIEEGNKIINEIIEKMKIENKSITIFNPNGWETKYPAKIPYYGNEDIHIEDECGVKIDAEKTEGNLIFTTTPISPYNFKTFYIKDCKIYRSGFIKREEEWENEFYYIWVDKKTGLIRGIYDKKNKKDVIPKANSIPEDKSSFWAENCANLIKLYWEKPHPMSAWIIGNIYKIENLIDLDNLEIKEGNTLVIFEVIRKYKETKIIQRTLLYRDFPFIDFEFETDWNIKGNSEIGVPMLRANFNFNAQRSDFYCEIPFGAMKRKNIPREYPALRWAGFKEDNWWAVIMNREKYGYFLDGNNLSLTLLRNSYEPDAEPDCGHHLVSYRLFFGKSNISEITKMALEYNITPVISEGEIKKQKLFYIEGNIVPTCFKKSIKDNTYILRMVEYEGKKGKFVITFDRNIKNLWISNVKEENLKRIPVKNKKIELNFKPHEIITLKIEF